MESNIRDKERRVYITTYDNPYSPSKEFKEWFFYDIDHGYNTCSILAKLTNTSGNMTPYDETEEVERAIDRLIEKDPLKIYKKIVEYVPMKTVKEL